MEYISIIFFFFENVWISWFCCHILKKCIVFRIYWSDTHYIQKLFLSSAQSHQNLLTSECSPMNTAIIVLKNDFFYEFSYNYLRLSLILSEWILRWDCFVLNIVVMMTFLIIFWQFLLSVLNIIRVNIVIRLFFMIWRLWSGSSEFQLNILNILL